MRARGAPESLQAGELQNSISEGELQLTLEIGD